MRVAQVLLEEFLRLQPRKPPEPRPRGIHATKYQPTYDKTVSDIRGASRAADRHLVRRNFSYLSTNNRGGTSFVCQVVGPGNRAPAGRYHDVRFWTHGP